MQSRRTGLSPLAIVLPKPPAPHRRSSLLSISSAASPHTPRSSGCFDAQPPPICYAQNRKSGDSWASSNADEMDVDWKPDQILLLTRTLDALPAHLLTPFNGPVPPSNLLDKIARGVAHAKGPADWPHSTRATRVKLLELARTRAKEDALVEQRRHAIQEEEHEANGCVDAVEIADGSADSDNMHAPAPADKPLRVVSIGPRRPLYRQSSMDFIKPSAAALKDNPNIARLSTRLQRPEQSYHPYARATSRKSALHENNNASNNKANNRRSESPPHSSDVPSLMAPSTPSSTTLNSVSSLSSDAPLSMGLSLSMGLRPRALRRTASTLSSRSSSLFSTSGASVSSGGMALDPRLQRVRRSDSFGAGSPPPLPPKDYPPSSMAGYKRAPSYGALAQEAKNRAAAKEKDKENEAMVVTTPTTPQKDQKHVRQLSTGSYPSSDEEEKARTHRAKKLRTRGAAGGGDVLMSPGGDGPPSSVPSSPATPAGARAKKAIAASPKVGRVREASGAMMTAMMREKESPVASRTRSNRGVLMSPAVKEERTNELKRTREGGGKEKEREKDKEKEKEKDLTKKRQHVKSASVGAGLERQEREMNNNNNKGATIIHSSPTLPATTSTAPAISTTAIRPPRMSAQRNPSMFGAELPLFKAAVSAAHASHAGSGTGFEATPVQSRLRSPEAALAERAPALLPALAAAANTNVHAHTRSRSATSNTSSAKDDAFMSISTPPAPTASLLPPTVPSSPASPATTTRHASLSPASVTSSLIMLGAAAGGVECPSPNTRVKTLRRVRRLAGARRISFGSLVPEEGEGLGGGSPGGSGRREREKVALGSAFQMM